MTASVANEVCFEIPQMDTILLLVRRPCLRLFVRDRVDGSGCRFVVSQEESLGNIIMISMILMNKAIIVM